VFITTYNVKTSTGIQHAEEEEEEEEEEDLFVSNDTIENKAPASSFRI